MLFRTFAPFNVDQRVSRQYRLSLFLPWTPPLLARPTLWHTLAMPDAPLPCASLFAFPGIPSTVLGVAAWQQHVRIRHYPRSWSIWSGADWQRVCRSDWPQCAMVVGRASSGQGIAFGRCLVDAWERLVRGLRLQRGWYAAGKPSSGNDRLHLLGPPQEPRHLVGAAGIPCLEEAAPAPPVSKSVPEIPFVLVFAAGALAHPEQC